MIDIYNICSEQIKFTQGDEKMYSHKFTNRVRYPECDRMSIVYHSNYIIWFDMGRTEFLRSIGYSYDKLEEEGIWLPVIEVGCTYKSPGRYDDNLTIEVYIQKLSKVKITFGYRVFKEDKILVEGFTSHAFTNPNLRPIGINKAKPDLYEKLIKCTQPS